MGSHNYVLLLSVQIQATTPQLNTVKHIVVHCMETLYQDEVWHELIGEFT